MHKNPIKFRYIVSCKDTSIKPIAQVSTQGLKLCQRQHMAYCKAIRNYTGINRFFIAENFPKISDDINHINQKSKARSVETFDFTSLYTFILHTSLKSNLNWFVEIAYNGARRHGQKYLSVYSKAAKWVTKHRETSCSFDKDSFIKVQNFLIDNAFFTIGEKSLRQTIGIPMGIDPAPFMANGHLYKFEFDFQQEMTKKNYAVARSLNHTHRYIDDISPLNDKGNFDKYREQIYPPELILLKQNNSIDSASVLELQIDIVEEKFMTGIFDKRNEFPFEVCRYPSTKSNIPDSTLYNVFYSQLIRIYRVCNVLSSFEIATQELFSRCINKGSTSKLLRNQISKFFQRNSPFKFDISCNDFLTKIL